MTTLSEELARFTAELKYTDLPPEAIERVRLHSLDLIGVCLLSADMAFANILRRTVSQSGGTPESTLMGSGGLKLPAPLATLFNGGLAHGNEFDDTYAPGRWHGSAPTVPACLAVAEHLHCSGTQFIVALAAALEVGCRLTRAAPELLYRGFHSTGTAGIFAATLGVGKLMGLESERLANALGISGSFASGTMEYLSDPEPWSKRIQVGHAGHSAIVAARAAANGFKGPRTILEGRHGYYRAYAGEGMFDLSQITASLGDDWQLLQLYPKRYPCDHIAQGYIDCAIALSRRHDFAPDRIERVECIVHPLVTPVMFEPHEYRYRPTNGWSARWSMPFNMAVALSDRAVTIDSYSDERAQDPETRALMAKVTYTEDETLAFPRDYPAWVRLHTLDGQMMDHQVLKVAGSRENPMLAEQYESKFIDNARRCLDGARVADIVRQFQNLPALTDMADVAAMYA